MIGGSTIQDLATCVVCKAHGDHLQPHPACGTYESMPESVSATTLPAATYVGGCAQAPGIGTDQELIKGLACGWQSGPVGR